MKRIFWMLPIVMAVVCAAQSAHAAQVQVGDQAPEIHAHGWLNSDGETIAKNSNKIVVVEFWATWCPPCRKSIPHLIAMNQKYKDKGVVFAGLTNEGAGTVKSFAATMKMDYPVGMGSTTSNAYGVDGIPCAFVIAPGGKVVWTGHPMEGLDQAIEAALKDTPPKKA